MAPVDDIIAVLKKIPSPDQEAALSASGNVLVNAGPGTGKTHLIAEKVSRLVVAGADPKRILLLTFSRRAVSELRDRVNRAGGVPCEIRTFHGFASRLLEAGGARFKTRRLLTPFAEALLFKAAIDRAKLATIDDRTRNSERFRGDVARFASDLRRSDRAALATLSKHATPRIADLLQITDRATKLRDELRTSDLNDLIARAVEALDDPKAAQGPWLAGRYDHLLIDEFQDIDRLQLALCERIGGTIFAVGDPAQSIYRFRGAVHGIFDEGAKRLQLQPFTLTSTHRCPQPICDLAAATPFIEAVPLKANAKRACTIDVRASRTTLDEAAYIADRVEDAMAGGIEPEQIGILLRSTRPLSPAIAAELVARQIPVASSGNDAFFNDAGVTILRLALRAFAHPGSVAYWAALLGAPALGFDPMAIRVGIARQTFGSVEDVISWLEARSLAAGISLDDLAKTLLKAKAEFEDRKIGKSTRTLIRGFRLIEALTKDADAASARVSIGRITHFAETLGEAQFALETIGEPASSARIVDAIADHVTEIGGDEAPADDVRGVRVMSIHGSKGLQFDVVIVGDAIEGKLPAQSRASTLFVAADRAVFDEAGIDVLDARSDDGMIEEASLWYVAVTRTKQTLHVSYAASGPDGAPQRVTRFLPPDMHPKSDVVPFERSRVRIERVLLASEDPEAEHALDVLAKRSPIVRAMVDEDDAFGEIEQRDVVVSRTLSVSAADDWLHCPRSFFYKYVLRLKGDESLSMQQGSDLHKVLEIFHGEFATFDATTAGDRPKWEARLRAIRKDVWEAETNAPAAIREASGVSADRTLERYAIALAHRAVEEPFRVIAMEQKIEIAYEHGTLRGKVDRIDRLADGSLAIRDYKSGRKKGKLADSLAKEIGTADDLVAGAIDSDFKPQLTFYRRGAEQHYDAPVKQLEYIFLKGSDKGSATGSDLVSIDESIAANIDRLESLIDNDFLRAFSEGAVAPLPTTTEPSNCKWCGFNRRRLCEGVEA